MRGVRDFLVNSRQAMIDYILVVSTSTPDKFPIPGSPDVANSDRKERWQVVESLRFRGANMPLLNREAIPLLPHLLDVPRHLAVISSAIVRRSNELLTKHQTNGITVDPDLDEFVNKCLEIEQQALRRVSKLAAHTRELRKQRAATSAGVVEKTPSSQASGIMRPSTSSDSYITTTSQRPSTMTSVMTQTGRKNSRQELRPSTATTYSDSPPTFGSVASRKRPSTTQGNGNGNIHEITLLRPPRSPAQTFSSPSTPTRGGFEKDTSSLQSVTKTPDKVQSIKTSPKPPRPILKRPSTAPSPSLVPMLAPTPEVPQIPLRDSQATGWSMFSSVVSTPKKDKEARKWLPRFSADDSIRRYPSSSENIGSPAGEKRKGFLRGLLSRK